MTKSINLKSTNFAIYIIIILILCGSIFAIYFQNSIKNNKLLNENDEIDENYTSFDESLGSILRFYNVYISRDIGGKEFKVYDICIIPADIEPTGNFSTGSTDLSSNTMIFRICKLFNDGKLLHSYVPPYCILENARTGLFQYIKPQIHFNKYKNIDDWIYNDKFLKSKDEFIEMFKHYAEEINNYHQN
jgi:hypothetical protein